MFLFPPNDHSSAINALVIVAQVVVIVIFCFAIHYCGNSLLQYVFRQRYSCLCDKDKRSTIVELNNQILTCFLIPFFVAGSFKLYQSPET